VSRLPEISRTFLETGCPIGSLTIDIPVFHHLYRLFEIEPDSLAASDPEAIRTSERLLFCAGDSHHNNYPALELRDRPPTPGLVRVLCHLAIRGCRLLIHNLWPAAFLLKQCLIPGIIFTACDHSIMYSESRNFVTSIATIYSHLQLSHDFQEHSFIFQFFLADDHDVSKIPNEFV
jgi:hypothetical protein